ncbi:MAG: 3-phosphoshikimate 1-carboxyvinyltransferase [Caldilineaceae bacterium]
MGRQDGNLAPLGIRPAQLRGGIRSARGQRPGEELRPAGRPLRQGPHHRARSLARRDHTERMLRGHGRFIEVYGNTIHSERPSAPLQPLDITVAGDISSAAFLIVAASVTPDSHVTLADVGVNPTRTGIIDVGRDGRAYRARNQREVGGEPVADLDITTSDLRGTTFGGQQIVTMIDELPVLAVAATQAHGRTVVKDAGELRVKETDRIATTVSELRKLGADIEPTDDGFIVNGPTPLMGGPVDAQGDHRLAMAMAVAGLIARGRTTVYGAEVTGDSFPGFEATLQALGAELKIEE